MGFDEPDQKHKLQGWVSGGDNTAAMARNYFKALYQNRDKPQFTRPGGIIALEIDQQAIKWRGEPMLANDLTPKTYRYTEYFAEDNHPTKKKRTCWTPPRALNSFTVSHSEAGYPVLILQPADTALYRVQRDAVGESFILTELYGSAGETLYFTDMQAKAGVDLYIPGDPRSRGAAEQRRFAGGRTVGAGGAGESFHRLLGQCEEFFHRRRAEGRRCGGESGGERAVDFLGKLREEDGSRPVFPR